MLPDQCLVLECRSPHGDPEGLHLVRAGDETAVVVRENGDGGGFEVRLEDPFARDVKVIAIDEGDAW